MNADDFTLLMRVEQWLYREARLLDSRRYDLWLELLDDDIHYRIPSRGYVRQGHVKDFSTWSVERELEVPDLLPLIDDDLPALRERIARLQTGMAWSETPPSISRRLVSNVMILDVDSAGRLSVVSTMLLHKVRGEGRVLFTGERRDPTGAQRRRLPFAGTLRRPR